MRIVGSATELRGLHYSMQLRQEQEQLSVRRHSTPPLHPSTLIKSQSRGTQKPKQPPAPRTDNSLGLALLPVLLRTLCGIDIAVISARELHQQLNSSYTTTKNAITWQHLAESLHDVLLPSHYPPEHLAEPVNKLMLPTCIQTNDGHTSMLDIQLTLSSSWYANFPVRPEHQIEPITILLDRPALELPRYSLYLELDLHHVEHHNPELIKQPLSRIQIWWRDGVASHRLVALGVEDIGVMYLDNLCLDDAAVLTDPDKINSEAHRLPYQQAHNLLHVDVLV